MRQLARTILEACVISNETRLRAMEALLLDILETLRRTNADALEQEEREKVLAALLHKHNQGLKNNAQHHSKKRLLPYYLKTKESDPVRWASWNIDADLENACFVCCR